MVKNQIFEIEKKVQHVKGLHNEYANATLKNIFIFGFLITTYSAKSMTLIFYLQYLGVLQIVDENK